MSFMLLNASEMIAALTVLVVMLDASSFTLLTIHLNDYIDVIQSVPCLFMTLVVRVMKLFKKLQNL